MIVSLMSMFDRFVLVNKLYINMKMYHILYSFEGITSGKTFCARSTVFDSKDLP